VTVFGSYECRLAIRIPLKDAHDLALDIQTRAERTVFIRNCPRHWTPLTPALSQRERE
jgi:hypothetical protein